MNNETDRDAYLQLGQRLKQQHADHLLVQLQIFRSALMSFINDHGDEILHNPVFRAKFNQITQSIGMDPLDLLLYSNTRQQQQQQQKKDQGNFIVGLSVKVVEICQETRDLNGGLIPLKELQSIVNAQASLSLDLQLDVSIKNIESAIRLLNTMGTKNYEMVVINNDKWLKFASLDNLSQDQIKIYELCQFMGGYVTIRLLQDNFQWDKIRCENVITEMMMNGMLWIDLQGEGGTQYWEPSWISN
ncbi:uncharacterized protein LODBEIA_P56220 [Lodderomyces beijingensis]|uniref:Vacuolar-sorting protein SNF8 n=1 Tax=Lodderomyces beijingensis TaxID=1775926 RepID=A0ABP0ZTD7_9ASCO